MAIDRPIGSMLLDLLSTPSHREFLCKFTLVDDDFNFKGKAHVKRGSEYINIISGSHEVFYKNKTESSDVVYISASDLPPEYECILSDIPKDILNDIRLHNVNLIFPRVRVLPSFTLSHNSNIYEGSIQPLYTNDSRELVRIVLPDHD